MVNKIRKNKKDIISGVLAVVVLLLLVFYGSNLGKVFGATFSWSQSSWTGGADTNDTADHSVLADRTDWNKYYSASSTISAGANIALSTTAASTTHTTDTDFSGGTNSSTTISGSGSGASVALSPSNSGTANFSYTGAQQTWTVPSGITSITVDMAGANGATNDSGGVGGNGGRVQTTLSVTPGSTLYIYVGGAGSGITGGYNGGGSSPSSGGGGGGASDIRQGGTALSNRVVVAGAGGGGGKRSVYCGGTGGYNGTAGCGGYNDTCAGTLGGAGGTQTAGGAGGTGEYPGNAGSSGVGGNGYSLCGGGGSGYYGGGGGSFSSSCYCSGAGGGGSSYSSGTNTTYTSGYWSSNGYVNISYTPPYYSSGTYTSASIDLGHKSDLTTLGFSKTVPSQIAFAYNKKYKFISAGAENTCVLKSNGNVYCYGDNQRGQSAAYTGGDAVGVSTQKNDSLYLHTCVLKSNGNVDCYGSNSYGQAADYTSGDAVGVSAGSSCTQILKSNGNTYAQGNNYSNQCVSYTSGDAVGVSAGQEQTCVLKSNGNVDCFGCYYNNYGQCADYTSGDAVGVSAGYIHTCVLKSNGNVDCYGANNQGQAADYTSGDAVGVSTGQQHTCVLKSNGNVDCYGSNSYGQATDYTSGDAVGVSAGYYHTCVLKSNGNVDCYGSNSYEQATDYTSGDAKLPYALKFQLAANNDNSTWNYVGPDGTANTYFTSTGTAIPAALDGNRYVKYKLYLGTTDTAYTPSLNDITINYSYYGSGSLTSSKYDTSSDANVIGGITWDEDATLPGGTTATVSLRTADSAANLDAASWTDFTNATTGCTKASGTVTCSSSAIPSAMKDGSGDQWVQYKITLTSTGVNTPTVDNINVTYVVNAPPQFDATFGTNGVSVSQISDSGDANWGKVKIQYAIRDTDADSGTITPNYITPSFEYNIGAGWLSIDSQYLAAGDTSNKAVATSTYTTYTAYWDARTHISGTYYATAQIRVTANDNEAANNTTTAMGANFALDVKNVAIAAFTLDSSADTIALNLSDDNNLEYKVSNNADFTGAEWQTVGGTSTSTTFNWTFSGAPSFETVYLTTRDTLGNTAATVSATAPSTPQNFRVYDISNLSTNSYKEVMIWDAYTASSTAAFSNYKIYRSTNGADYSLLTTISNIDTNSYTDSTVASTTTYYYKVRVTDTDGDISSYSTPENDLPDGQGGSDFTAPAITAVSVAETQATWVKITWTTDEMANSKVEYSTAAAGNYSSNASSTAYVTSHSVTVTGLTPATDYIFRIKSKDILANEGSADGTPFTTASGPAITDVVTSSVNDNSAEITWNTNNDSNSYVIYSTNTSSLTADLGVSTAGSGTAVGGSGPLYYHKVTLPNLLSRTTYYYYVKSIDASDNIVTDKNSSNYYSFSTTYDTKAPVISNISTPVRTADTMIIFWNTDELANSQVDFGLEANVYSNSGTLNPTLTTGHALTLSNLTTETIYHYRIRSADAQGNLGYSTDNIASTTSARDVVIQYVGGGGSVAASDTTPPSVSNIKTSAINAFDATVSFDTNELATGYVLYGKDKTYGNIASSIDFKTSGHSVKLPGLVLGTEYHYKVKAQDKFGNFGDSGDKTLTTKFATETLDNLVTLENAESFQNQLEGIIESIMPSLSPPFISKIEVSDVTENSAIVRWVTNVKAYGSAAYVADNEYDGKNTNPYKSEISDTQEKSKGHEVNLVNLSPSTKYHLQAKSYAIPGVVGKSKDVEFTTKSSKIAPEVVKVGNTEIEIRWTTSSETSSFVEFKNRATGQTGQKGDSAMAKVHSVVLDNLNPATSYEIKAFGYDANNNIVEGNATTVKTKQDVVAPELSSIKIDNALVPGRTDRLQTIIFWKTNEPANSVVYYEEGISNNEDLANKTGEEKEYTADHAVIIANFKPSTIYRIKIISEDEAGNKTSSPIRAILTPRSAESIVDVIFKNFQESFGFLKKLQR